METRKFDFEAIYDAEISPLMEQIIAICKKHGIPMVADFQLTDGSDCEEGPMFCTTTILPDDSAERMKKMYAVAKPEKPYVLALTIMQAAPK